MTGELLQETSKNAVFFLHLSGTVIRTFTCVHTYVHGMKNNYDTYVIMHTVRTCARIYSLHCTHTYIQKFSSRLYYVHTYVCGLYVYIYVRMYVCTVTKNTYLRYIRTYICTNVC